MLWLHIPKTGGTSMRYLLRETKTDRFRIAANHRDTLHNTQGPVAFVVRDPLERFCSGFWERATTPLRASKAVQARQRGYHVWGYPKYSPLETEIFENYKTPNDLLTRFRTQGVIPIYFPENLANMIDPLTTWLGPLENYQKAEHRVVMAVDIKCLDVVIKELVEQELPKDPFRARRRDLFEIPQSYEISPENQQWFREEYRREDYRLVEYIRSRPYYRAPAP